MSSIGSTLSQCPFAMNNINNGLSDWESSEIDDLEEQASKCTDSDKCRQLIVLAAELCMRYQSSWLSPPIRDFFRQRLRHLLNQGDQVKAALATAGKPDKDQVPFQYQRFVPREIDNPKPHRPEPSVPSLDNKQQILLLQRSKFGHCRFPPWPKDGITPAILAKESKKSHPEPSLSQKQLERFVGWQLAEELLGPASVTSVAENPSDVVQDVGVDCSVIASICAFMAQPDVGERIISFMVFPSTANASRYYFKFHFNGCSRAVEIDRLLPAAESGRHLHALDRNNPGLIWPALLEKAYLTIWGGYDFAGSNSNTDLFIMTGWIPEFVVIHEERSAEDFLWPKLWHGFKSKTVLATFGTSKLSQEAEEEYGLASNHAYAVLDLSLGELDVHILLKNPWNQETTTKWKAGSSPGTFWIPYNEACTLFKWAYLNWYPGIFRQRRDNHFVWDLAQPTASTLEVNSPQFAIGHVTKSCQLVWILLNRHFQDCQDGNRFAKGHISIVACSRNGDKVYDADLYVVSRSRKVDAMQTLLRLVIPANTTYTIVPKQNNAGAGNHWFTLSAFSDASITLTKAVQHLSYSEMIPGRWIKDFTAFGSIDEVLFYRNPQYCLEICQATHMAITLESLNATTQINLLLYTSGKQIFTVRKTGIVLGKTEYHAGRIVVCTDDWRPLRAGKYTLLVSSKVIDEESPFSIYCESDKPVSISRIQGEESLTARHQLPRAPFSRDTNVLAMPLHFKQYSRSEFRVVANFVSSDLANQQQSPISIRLERVSGLDKQILGQTGSWDEKFQIAPKQGIRLMDLTVTGDGIGEYFLVLERIAVDRPMGSVEVWSLEIVCEGFRKDQITPGEGWIEREE